MPSSNPIAGSTSGSRCLVTAPVYSSTTPPEPALVIHELQHGAGKGAIGLMGPPDGSAFFSNFTYREDDELEARPGPRARRPHRDDYRVGAVAAVQVHSDRHRAHAGGAGPGRRRVGDGPGRRHRSRGHREAPAPGRKAMPIGCGSAASFAPTRPAGGRFVSATATSSTYSSTAIWSLTATAPIAREARASPVSSGSTKPSTCP